MSSLVIPLDMSQIPEEERKQLKVKVAVDDGEKITSTVVKVSGKGEVKLEVDGKRSLTVAIGSDSASDEDLFRLQTINVQVSPHQWQDKPTLTLPPIVITPHWWRLWLLWCRDFVINGRVVCADGSPVPGAEVRAYDVDFFWWWSSTQQVGPAVVTDAAGHFTIKFRWCCGWWPWWWWRLRRWRLDTDLFDKIRPIVELNPRLKLPDPDPEPNLDFLALTPQPELPRRLEERELPSRFRRERLAATVPTGRKLDPSADSNGARTVPLPVAAIARFRASPHLAVVAVDTLARLRARHHLPSHAELRRPGEGDPQRIGVPDALGHSHRPERHASRQQPGLLPREHATGSGRRLRRDYRRLRRSRHSGDFDRRQFRCTGDARWVTRTRAGVTVLSRSR